MVRKINNYFRTYYKMVITPMVLYGAENYGAIRALISRISIKLNDGQRTALKGISRSLPDSLSNNALTILLFTFEALKSNALFEFKNN